MINNIRELVPVETKEYIVYISFHKRKFSYVVMYLHTSNNINTYLHKYVPNDVNFKLYNTTHWQHLKVEHL